MNICDLGLRSSAASRFVAYAVVMATCSFIARAAAAQSIFGTLSNFDVFNDTGQETHGFEIELDGVSKADVSFTFGSPYQRYGNPTAVDFAGGVYVRYESPYDAVNKVFTAATPMAPMPITPTAGHACWTGGSGNYLSSGCEHFGVGVNGAPTGTTYRWLIADPNNAGSLQPSGTKVSIPAPTWSVVPPQPGVGPIVRAVVPAEPPEAQQQFGDAMWVKVYVTESENEAELHHLVTDDPAVPNDVSETETEWAILQNGPGGGNNELANEHEVAAGKNSVTRRYEFYKYTGAYDPESHEALCAGGGGGGSGGGSCSVPAAGELGDYIGAQMAALNLAPAGPTPTPTDTGGPTTTATVTSIATALATATATQTVTTVACSGDCHGDHSVTIDELITLVDIALGIMPPSACPYGIPEGQSVQIAFLIRAVNNALDDACAVRSR